MTTTTAITKTCTVCGVPVAAEIPDELRGMFREMAEALPVRCPEHEAEAEARYREEDARGEQARIASLVERRERDCGIPVELRRLAWEPDSPAVRAAKRWAEGEQRGVLLIGMVGRGKSCLAATAAWERLRHEMVRWTSASAFVNALDHGFGSVERQGALKLAKGTRSLVLDDLDKARPTATVAEQLLLAIDSRITRGGSLLVTMNTEPSELAKHFPEPFGDAIVSRLRGYCKAYRLNGPDRRVAP